MVLRTSLDTLDEWLIKDEITQNGKHLFLWSKLGGGVGGLKLEVC